MLSVTTHTARTLVNVNKVTTVTGKRVAYGPAMITVYMAIVSEHHITNATVTWAGPAQTAPLTVAAITIPHVAREWDSVTNVKIGQWESFVSHANRAVTVTQPQVKDAADVIVTIMETKRTAFVMLPLESVFAKIIQKVRTVSAVKRNFMVTLDTVVDVITNVNLEEC